MAQENELTTALATRRILGNEWLISWPLLVGVYVYVSSVLQGRNLLVDGDTYSHIAIGKWILANRVVPEFDYFSHTMQGTRWTAFEWLSQVALAAAEQWSGWTGVVVITALAFAVTMAMMTRALLRHLEPIYVILFVALATAMTFGHALARPHMLAMPLLMAWTIGLVRAADANRSPSLWLLPLMVLWANLHGGFTLGLALGLAFACEALLAAWRGDHFAGVARSWCSFLLLAFGCSLLTPNGPRALLVTWQVLFEDNYALQRIDEWRSPNFHVFQFLELWLLGFIMVVLRQGLRLPSIRLLLLLGLIHLSLKHIRYVELLGLLAPLFLAAPLTHQWIERRQGKRQLVVADRLFNKLAGPAGQGAVAASLAIALAIPFWVSIFRPLQPPESIAPLAAIEAAKQAGLKGSVLNMYEWGGYLLYRGIPPFIDGRSDMYRDAFIKDYFEALELHTSDGLQKMLDKHDIEWTLLPPRVSAIAVLDRLPGWRRIYADDTAVVHARASTR